MNVTFATKGFTMPRDYKITNQILTSKYTLSHKTANTTFLLLIWSGFAQKTLKLHTQKIPCFEALDVGFKIFKVELFSSLRDCRATFFLKNTLFKAEVAW